MRLKQKKKQLHNKKRKIDIKSTHCRNACVVANYYYFFLSIFYGTPEDHFKQNILMHLFFDKA